MTLKYNNLLVIIFIVSYHIGLLVLMPIYIIMYGFNLGIFMSGIVLFCLCALSITAGYHRLYSHKTYQLNKVAQIFLLFFGTLATQESVIKWAHDHRKHHMFVDTDKDPYSIKKGFWYAHILWLFENRQSFDSELVKDLSSLKILQFQNKYYVYLLVLFNLFVILTFAFIFKDLFGAFVFVFLMRLFLTHHITWFINSIAHTFGSKSFSKEHSAVDNWFVAFLTFGEGYHNYHHTFSSDYRNGVRWYQYDPTKVLIWCLSKLGLAKDLRTFDYFTIKRKTISEERRILIEKIKNRASAKYEFLESKIEQLSLKLNDEIIRIKQSREEYKLLKKSRVEKQTLEGIRLKINELKKSYKSDFKEWRRLYRGILRMPQIG